MEGRRRQRCGRHIYIHWHDGTSALEKARAHRGGDVGALAAWLLRSQPRLAAALPLAAVEQLFEAGRRAASEPPSAHSGGGAKGGAKAMLGAARRASQAVAALSRDEKTVLSTAPSNDGLPLAVRSARATAKVAPEPGEPAADAE